MPGRTRYLSPITAQVVARTLAEELYAGYEPSSTAFVFQGKEGEGLLESALALPRQPYYKGTLRKAAALLRSLIKNHPFIDGNKRFALAATTLFLGFNGYQLLSPKEETVSFALQVAQEENPSLHSIESWLRRFSLPAVLFKSARVPPRFQELALSYPGGSTALRRTTAEYMRLLSALNRQLDKLLLDRDTRKNR